MRLVKEIFEIYVNKVCNYYKTEYNIILDEKLFVVNTPKGHAPTHTQDISRENPPYLDYIVDENTGAMVCELLDPPMGIIYDHYISDKYKMCYKYYFSDDGVRQVELDDLDLVKHIKLNLLIEKL